ncbi:MAG TPA: hypothetical protein VE439_07055 [Anaerolineae bacterium]|jgi:hypothetical protein|nr:hypothetical protein [Anaerolineae bacterium]
MRGIFWSRQFLNSFRSWALITSIFLGAVALTFLLGFFGYIVLFILLGLLFYLRRSAIHTLAGLHIESAIDAILVAIIAALFIDIVQGKPMKDTAEHAYYSKGTGSSTTGAKQASDKEQLIPNDTASQEDTDSTNSANGNGLIPPPEGASTLQKGSSRATTTYTYRSHASTSQYGGGKESSVNRSSVSTGSRNPVVTRSTTITTRPPATQRRSRGTTVPRRPRNDSPPTTTKVSVTTHKETPTTSNTTVQQPPIDIEVYEEVEQGIVNGTR